MGFEAVSCAIARVIVDYHAYQTQTRPSYTESSDVLEAKIHEATTGNNSSRRTLLQYMQFGLVLSEQARSASTADEMDTIQPQLIQFIQNLQRLLTTTNPSFFASTLTFPISEEKTLTIYRLNDSKTTAHKLILNLLTELEFSPGSTKKSIQENLVLRFQNQAFSTELEARQQHITELKLELDKLTTKPLISEKTPLSFIINPDNTVDEAEDWETITHNTLTTQNNHLVEQLEETKEHIDMLKTLINNVKPKPEKPQPIADENLTGFYHRTQNYGRHRVRLASNTITTQPIAEQNAPVPTKKAQPASATFSLTALLAQVSITNVLPKTLDLDKLEKGYKCD